MCDLLSWAVARRESKAWLSWASNAVAQPLQLFCCCRQAADAEGDSVQKNDVQFLAQVQ